MKDVQSYLTDLPASHKQVFTHIQSIVTSAAPEAVVVISYGLPTFKYKGKVLLHFGAFKDHLSIFPGPAAIAAHVDKLAGFTLSKGTIRFSADHPLPDEVIRTLIDTRITAIDGYI